MAQNEIAFFPPHMYIQNSKYIFSYIPHPHEISLEGLLTCRLKSHYVTWFRSNKPEPTLLVTWHWDWGLKAAFLYNFNMSVYKVLENII